MTTPPRLTDRTALHNHRARANPDAAAFLHDEARTQIEERLEEVNRTFTRPAIITAFPDLWRDLLPNAEITSDGETLSLEPGAHDLVINALTMHWADDPIGQLVQARHALVPDGLFLGVLLSGETLHELRAALGQAEIALRGGLSPRIAPLGEIRDLGALLQRAGFALPVADCTPLNVTYPDLRTLLHDLRDMGETNALAARDRRFAPRDLFTQAEAIYRSAFATPDARLTATFELCFLTGWAPDESQQKPLRPGSAKARLSDALGVAEQSGGESAPGAAQKRSD